MVYLQHTFTSLYATTTPQIILVKFEKYYIIFNIEWEPPDSKTFNALHIFP